MAYLESAVVCICNAPWEDHPGHVFPWWRGDRRHSPHRGRPGVRHAGDARRPGLPPGRGGRPVGLDGGRVRRVGRLLLRVGVVMVGWPHSPTVDVLFLIPGPWRGRYGRRVAVSVALVGFGSWPAADGPRTRAANESGRGLGLSAAGCSSWQLHGNAPRCWPWSAGAFPWPVFLVAWSRLVVGCGISEGRGSRYT